MKLLAYEVDKRSFLGVFNENETWAYPISAAGMEYRSMKDLIREAGPSEMEMLDYISKKAPGDVTGAAPVEEIKIVSPIPEPDQDIICLGINYMDHAAESARFQKEEFARPEKAIYFSKRVNRTNDPDGIIPAHKNLTNQLDYEAELAVIIKKDAKDVKPEEVKDYIPSGLKFVKEDNSKWTMLEDGNTVTTDQLKDKLLQPGESAVVEITLQWINGQNNFGLKQNWAEISKDKNDSDSPDIDSVPNNKKEGEDDIDDASVLLSVKTGSAENYIVITGSILAIVSAGIVLIKKFVI